MGSEPPKFFQNFKVALNPHYRISLYVAKGCILSCSSQFDNKKWGSPNSFLSYELLKLNIRVFLAGHNVAMVTYFVTKMITMCSPVVRHELMKSGYNDPSKSRSRKVL